MQRPAGATQQSAAPEPTRRAVLGVSPKPSPGGGTVRTSGGVRGAAQPGVHDAAAASGACMRVLTALCRADSAADTAASPAGREDSAKLSTKTV
eukprot:83096-Chlamydomonas_euryale.AAC.6